MKVLVTAGPTREAIDPVRFVSNRSSGKMGYAIAQAARDAGHTVRLISGPVALPPPADISLVRVTSAADMLAAVEQNLAWCDWLVMAAAVADWRPKQASPIKLKKREMNPVLELEANPDILASVKPLKGKRTFIGFAAETGDPEVEARRKLAVKGLDMIVANDVSQPDAGFEVDTNRVRLITPDSDQSLPLMSKLETARRIIDWAEKR